jgi:hypothetical protein
LLAIHLNIKLALTLEDKYKSLAPVEAILRQLLDRALMLKGAATEKQDICCEQGQLHAKRLEVQKLEIRPDRF